MIGRLRKDSPIYRVAFFIVALIWVIIAFVLLAQIIERLLENHPTSVAGLFFGLVLASIIVAGFMVDTWNIYRVVLGVATGIAVFVLLGVRAGPIQEPTLLVFSFQGRLQSVR